jgi:hypothetical protein
MICTNIGGLPVSTGARKGVKFDEKSGSADGKEGGHGDDSEFDSDSDDGSDGADALVPLKNPALKTVNENELLDDFTLVL